MEIPGIWLLGLPWSRGGPQFCIFKQGPQVTLKKVSNLRHIDSENVFMFRDEKTWGHSHPPSWGQWGRWGLGRLVVATGFFPTAWTLLGRPLEGAPQLSVMTSILLQFPALRPSQLFCLSFQLSDSTIRSKSWRITLWTSSFEDLETFALMSSHLSAHMERIREGGKLWSPSCATVGASSATCYLHPWWVCGCLQGSQRKVLVIGITLTTISPNVLLYHFSVNLTVGKINFLPNPLPANPLWTLHLPVNIPRLHKHLFTGILYRESWIPASLLNKIKLMAT